MSFSIQQLASFSFLAIIMSITPGPNNIMVLFSSVRFGTNKTLPHILGASLGSAFMLFLVGVGFHKILSTIPQVLLAIKYIGIAYIFYLSWQIFIDTSLIQEDDEQKPMNLIQAILFQWINPKSWIMASIAISTCLPMNFTIEDIIFYSIIFIGISFPCVWVWAILGSVITKFIRSIKIMRIFNISCACLLSCSGLLMIFS